MKQRQRRKVLQRRALKSVCLNTFKRVLRHARETNNDELVQLLTDLVIANL